MDEAKLKEELLKLIQDKSVVRGDRVLASGKISNYYIDGKQSMNERYRIIDKFIKEHMPRVKMIIPEGTYLAWLDFSNYNLTDMDLQELMQKKAKIALDDGYIFGAGGEQFQRINFACPRTILEKALKSIEKSLEGIN